MPKARRPQHWVSIDDPLVPLERNLHGHPLAGLLWEKQLEKVLIEERCGQVPGWECPYLHRKMPVYVDDMKMARVTQNMPKMWAIFAQEVDLDDPVSVTDQLYLGCTQRAA